jgi:hypothetical protein
MMIIIYEQVESGICERVHTENTCQIIGGKGNVSLVHMGCRMQQRENEILKNFQQRTCGAYTSQDQLLSV